MRLCAYTTSRSHKHAGDSLTGSYPPPVQLVAYTQQWLRARFTGPFQDLGCSLVHAIQPDTFSCVICAGNTVAHGIFGDPLWNVQCCGLERTSWFIKLQRPKVRTVAEFPKRKKLIITYSTTSLQPLNSARAIMAFLHHS